MLIQRASHELSRIHRLRRHVPAQHRAGKLTPQIRHELQNDAGYIEEGKAGRTGDDEYDRHQRRETKLSINQNTIWPEMNNEKPVTSSAKYPTPRGNDVSK